jgi:hypothetical protein
VPNGRRVQGYDPCHAWTHICELPPSVILLLIRWHCAWPRTAPPSSSVSLYCCVLRFIQPVRRDGWLCSPNGFIVDTTCTHGFSNSLQPPLNAGLDETGRRIESERTRSLSLPALRPSTQC